MNLQLQIINVLLVEDNPGDAFLIQEQLRQASFNQFNLNHVDNLQQAIANVQQDSFDIILLDLILPDSQGIETLNEIQVANPHIPIILLTGINDLDLATEALRKGAQDYLVKGQTNDALLERAIRYAIERKQIQEQLEKQILELEGFSYMVSHDLRNPLTNIISICWLLKEQEKECVENILSSCYRMKELIQGLLILSQVEHSELEIQLVDISKIVKQIASKLQQQQPERQVEFVIAPQIMAQGDPKFLKIALENLLNNSWKYTGEKECPRIEFGTLSLATPDLKLKYPYPRSLITNETQITNHQLVYFVRDNGVGFDPQKAAKLFTPFQRLHNRDQFEGTGIGLAIVKRIIEQHGGQIWFDAEIDRGATFYFILGNNQMR